MMLRTSPTWMVLAEVSRTDKEMVREKLKCSGLETVSSLKRLIVLFLGLSVLLRRSQAIIKDSEGLLC